MPPLAARALIAQSCGSENWDKLLASFEAARQSVIDQWGKLLDRKSTRLNSSH